MAVFTRFVCISIFFCLLDKKFHTYRAPADYALLRIQKKKRKKKGAKKMTEKTEVRGSGGKKVAMEDEK